MYIKNDKNGQICGIWESRTSGFTPQNYKSTLNMFQGQVYNKRVHENVLKYLTTSIAAQEGSEDAKKELRNINVSLNYNEGL